MLNPEQNSEDTRQRIKLDETNRSNLNQMNFRRTQQSNSTFTEEAAGGKQKILRRNYNRVFLMVSKQNQGTVLPKYNLWYKTRKLIKSLAQNTSDQKQILHYLSFSAAMAEITGVWGGSAPPPQSEISSENLGFRRIIYTNF